MPRGRPRGSKNRTTTTEDTSDNFAPANSSDGVHDAVYRSFYRKCLVTKIAHESALSEAKSKLGEHRSLLKDAKKAGVDTDALSHSLAARLQDPDEVVIRERNKLRMLGLSGVLNFDQISEITGVKISDASEEEQAEIDMGRAAERGYHAGKNNGAREDNPHPQGSENYVSWDKAWLQAQADIAEEMRPRRMQPASTARSKPTNGNDKPGWQGDRDVTQPEEAPTTA